MAGAGEPTFEHGDGFERREDERRIDAGQESAYDKENGQVRPKAGGVEQGEAKASACDGIEGREEGQDQYQGQDDRQGVDKKRLEEELGNQLPAQRAEGLAYAYFLGPFHGAGSGQ